MRNLGTKRGRLSAEERSEIERLAMLGLKPGPIAQRLDRHPATINFAMHCMGLRAPASRTFSYVRNGRPVVSWSAADDARIQALRAAGMTTTKVAEIISTESGISRSGPTVRVRLMMLANVDSDVAGAPGRDQVAA